MPIGNGLSGDRLLGSDIIVMQMTSDTPGTSLGADTRMMTEVNSFQVRWIPDFVKTWPAGAIRYHYQLAGGYYEVQMDCGQFGGGFISLARKQQQASQQGNPIPMIRLVRKAQKGDKGFTETYVAGIVTSAENIEGLGNVDLTTRVTIEFPDMA